MLSKKKSRLVRISEKSLSAKPVNQDRLRDTDHISRGDIRKHVEMWYKILSDNGMVVLRLSENNVLYWVKALKKSGFNVPGEPHGISELQLLGKVLFLTRVRVQTVDLFVVIVGQRQQTWTLVERPHGQVGHRVQIR